MRQPPFHDSPYLDIISDKSATDQWMDKMINKKAQVADHSDWEQQDNDPFTELDRFFAARVLSHDECSDVVAWYGVSVLLLEHVTYLEIL